MGLGRLGACSKGVDIVKKSATKFVLSTASYITQQSALVAFLSLLKHAATFCLFRLTK